MYHVELDSLCSCRPPSKCPTIFMELLSFTECSGTLKTDVHLYLLFGLRFRSLVGNKPNELCPYSGFTHNKFLFPFIILWLTFPWHSSLISNSADPSLIIYRKLITPNQHQLIKYFPPPPLLHSSYQLKLSCIFICLKPFLKKSPFSRLGALSLPHSPLYCCCLVQGDSRYSTNSPQIFKAGAVPVPEGIWKIQPPSTGSLDHAGKLLLNSCSLNSSLWSCFFF